MAHSSTESAEDYDEERGEYRDEDHGEDHGEYHDEDHGEHRDEDHGEHRIEDHGEHLQEDHGEYHDEDHGEYDEEDHAEYHDEDHGEYAFELSEFRIGGASALLKYAVRAPGMKIVEWSAKSGQAWGVTRARVQEQMSKAGATIGYGVYSVSHPFHPIRREDAKEAERQKKALASDRRKQREAAARGKAAAKVAKAREGHIEILEEGER